MRVNLPITQQEYLLRDDDLIVSRTDTKGRITYANPIFLRTSGFDMDELRGKAHNIVRHPDMPPQAYADMWADLQAEHPWSGIVKNRRKNGDCYWVRANVTPVREHGQVVGYMSVRTKPSGDEIAAAAEAYRLLRENKDSRLGIEHGKAIRRGLTHGFYRLLRLPASLRMAIHTAGGIGFMVAAALASPLGGPAWLGLCLAALGSGWLVGGWLWLQRTWLGALQSARVAANMAASSRSVIRLKKFPAAMPICRTARSRNPRRSSRARRAWSNCRRPFARALIMRAMPAVRPTMHRAE